MNHDIRSNMHMHIETNTVNRNDIVSAWHG